MTTPTLTLDTTPPLQLLPTTTILPRQWKPRAVADFVGRARQVAAIVDTIVAQARAAGNAPIRILFNGPPGTGKSSLAEFVIQQLGCLNKWSTTKFNGIQMKIETMEEMAASLSGTSLFSEWRALWWDEVDNMSRAAQVRALTFLDDLPPATAVIATTERFRGALPDPLPSV